MSINVTVSGNPVNIKRGKMVTSDPYTTKKEFEKRRLLRLEQVRQQSKELAEGVRNKVQREKKKQMGEIEKEGKEKLKSWQNRKLLELQNQYRDALDEIGVGHKEAEELENESDIFTEQKLRNEEIAQNRGKHAKTKQQVQKNKENYKKAIPIQHKKLVRDIENTRAALVSCIKKNNKCQNKAKKPKASADINITIPDDSDFEEETATESTSHLSSIQEEGYENSEEFCECSECSDEKVSLKTPPDNAENTSRKESYRSALSDHINDADQLQIKQSLKSTSKSSQDLQEIKSKPKSFHETIDERRQLIEDFRNRPRDVPLDTRISDRIKRRQRMISQPDFCDDECNPIPIPEVPEKIQIREKSVPYFEKIDEVPNKKDPLELSDECVCCKCHTTSKPKSTVVQTDLSDGNRQSKCSCGPDEFRQNKNSANFISIRSAEVPKQQELKSTEKGYRPETISSQRVSGKTAGTSTEIPSKPLVKLKDPKQPSTLGTQQSTASSNAYKVRHYDFPNRYEGEIPSTSYVERITTDSLQVVPNFGSEAEWHEKMKQRDREAHMRGKRALEKQRIQRDYEDMMKKLPILQRKDHIAQIGTDKPEYHMSEERLKQREREKQNRLENAYTQAIPELRPQIITLPSRKHEIPKTDEPFEILDGEDARTLNLGKWDTETKPKQMFSAEEVQEIIKAFTIQKPEDRKTKLKQLLKSLKLQKEQLINEIQSLPKDDSINALLSDLNSFSDSDENRHKSSRRKKKEMDKEKSEKKRRREDSDASNTSLDDRKHHKDKHGKSPSKKVKKSRAKVLVLQNSSTQTTPKATKDKESSTTTTSTETSSSGLPSNVKTCNKCHVPCDCNKDTESNSEEVCKIVIKLNEDDLPEVAVVRSGTRDKGDVSEKAMVTDVQREKIPKSPRKEKEKTIKSPSNERRQPKPPETLKISQKNATILAEKKSVATETDTFKEPLPEEPKKSISALLPEEDRTYFSSRKSNQSWKDVLSKNSMSTSSTSYLSPPDFSKSNITPSSIEDIQLSLFNLGKKPQQKNVGRFSTIRQPKEGTREQRSNQKRSIFKSIKRLLSMSKFSVEELAISSSDVQTPNQSVIELETNNPMASLHNVIKFINVRTAEIAHHLSMSSDITPVPPNSLATEDTSGSGSKIQQDESQQLPEKDINDTSSSHTKEQLVSQYTDVTDSCNQRIAHLAALIEELRQEKIRLLQSPSITQKASQMGAFNQPLPCDRGVCDQGPCNLPKFDQVTPGSDKDNSTKYLDFPPSGEKSKGTNSSASMDEEELNRRLLEIDMSLADKLKKFREQRDDRSVDSSGKSDKSALGLVSPSVDKPLPIAQYDFALLPEDQLVWGGESEDSLDQMSKDFVKRLKQLIKNGGEEEPVDNKSKKKEKKQPTQSPFAQTESESNHEFSSLVRPQTREVSPITPVPFVPFLVNIPKLPILQPESEGEPLEYPLEPEKRHPPPSKGLITAKKFNGNISLVPHELSTIVEADSQLSTKISPNNSKTNTSLRDTNMPFTPTIEEKKSLPTHKSPNEVSDNQPQVLWKKQCNDKSCKALNDQPESRKTSPAKSENTLLCKSDKSIEKTQPFKYFDSESSKALTCNEQTCTSLISTSSSLKKSTSSSGSDMESIEAMLRSIGMDWAIPTLHKTQEALALTSTSSSDDLSSKKKGKGRRSISSSEVSLKEFLKKQVAGNIEKVISSSSIRSDASPASFLQECSEISAIQANSSSEKVKQRTSTPVLSSKSSSKTKEDQLFTGASDISSVKNSSCEAYCKKLLGKQSFHSLGSDEELSSKSSIK